MVAEGQNLCYNCNTNSVDEGIISINLFSDSTVEYSGLKFSYFVEQSSTTVSMHAVYVRDYNGRSTGTIGPLGPDGNLCAGNAKPNGITLKGGCDCLNGYEGEDCSAAKLRPDGPECDPSKPLSVCAYIDGSSFSSMFAVASYGEDEEGRGSIGIGKVAKPLKTIKFAIQLAQQKTNRDTVELDASATLSLDEVFFSGDGVHAGFAFVGADLYFPGCTYECYRTIVDNTCSGGKCTSVLLSSRVPRDVCGTVSCEGQIVHRDVVPIVILYPGTYSGEVNTVI